MRQILVLLRWSIPFWLVQFITSALPDNRYTIRLRGLLSKPFIGKCGSGFTLASGVTINYPNKLHLGSNVYLAKGVWLNAIGGIKLEDEVVLGPYVVISSLQHTFKNNSVKQGASIAAPVVVGYGSWLASHVSIKCGVKIGKGNLIAANAFVASNTQNNSIYGGVPARFIKENKDSEGDIKSAADLL